MNSIGQLPPVRLSVILFQNTNLADESNRSKVSRQDDVGDLKKTDEWNNHSECSF